MQLVRIQQITEHIPCFSFSPDNRFHYSNAHPQAYSVKSPSWNEGSSGGENKQRSIKEDGSAVPDPRVEPAAAEMSWGGGGGGRLDEGGVLARAAALGDGHLRLLLQFDVDHWGSLVKRLHL